MTDQAALRAEAPRYLRPARRTQEATPLPEAAATPAATAPLLLALFLAALLLPLNFSLGSLSLTPSRVVLLVAFVPLVFRWLTGAAGRVTTGDVLIALHCLWVGLALIALHGPDRIPYAGITIIEIFGSYLMGRLLVRNATDYRMHFRNVLIALVLLAPFVLAEMLTTRLVLSEILRSVAPTHMKLQTDADQMRMGFYRAQAVLEHPILWGVFCSLTIANAFYIWRERFFRSVILTGFATGMTFTSLSSGPLLAAAIQLGIIGWGWITRNAWWVLISLVVLGYVVIDLISNRSPVQVLITYLTFNSGSAYWRLHIWTYGSAEVLRHPLFGIGLNDWARPSWMWHRLGRQFLAADCDALRAAGLSAAGRRHHRQSRSDCSAGNSARPHRRLPARPCHRHHRSRDDALHRSRLGVDHRLGDVLFRGRRLAFHRNRRLRRTRVGAGSSPRYAGRASRRGPRSRGGTARGSAAAGAATDAERLARRRAQYSSRPRSDRPGRGPDRLR